MPAKPGKSEQVFIKLFVSAYENYAWVGSKIDRLDEHIDGAVEALITREDGKTMAIEHTLVEPFFGDKHDFAMFERTFLRIEDDKSLAIPNTGITVFVPVGILDGRRPQMRNVIVKSIHSWIVDNRLNLLEGEHKYQCGVHGMSPVTLTAKRSTFKSSRPNPGKLLVRRQQVVNDLDKVIEKALQNKVPKLVNTKADRHVLFLERDQFSFYPELIFAEIERQRPNFPLLDKVDDIWHIESIGYQDGYLYFELWRDGRVLATMMFENGVLVDHSKNGMQYPM